MKTDLRSAFRCGILAVLLVAGFPWAAPAEPSPEAATPDRIAALVEGLGAAAYTDRQTAAEALLRIGRPALPALRAASESDDPEVRTRAGELVREIRLGIAPDWPPDAVALARAYQTQTAGQRAQTCRALVDRLGARAVSFLVTCLDDADDALARTIGGLLSDLQDKGAWEQVLEYLPAARNPAQARIRAMAIRAAGEPGQLPGILGNPKLPKDERKALCDHAVQLLLDARGTGWWTDLEPLSGQLCASVPGEGRLRYLRAELLRDMEKPDEARALQQQALALDPDREAPHYVRGEFLLQKLRRPGLSAREWQKILEIPPRDDVYDMNAHLRLATIAETAGKPAAAADHLEQVVKAYEARKKAGGSGYGMVGGSPDDLRKKIAALQRKVGQVSLKVTIAYDMPEEEMLALRRELGGALASMRLNVQPYGLRLLGIPNVRVAYRPETHRIAVLLGGTTCNEEELPKPVPPEGARIVLANLDEWRVLRIDGRTHEVEEVRAFKTDYTMRVKLPGVVAKLRDVVVRINGKDYRVEDLRKPIPFDFLPEKFRVEIEGSAADGRKFDQTYNLKVRQPPLPPLRPGEDAPPAAAPPEPITTTGGGVTL